MLGKQLLPQQASNMHCIISKLCLLVSRVSIVHYTATGIIACMYETGLAMTCMFYCRFLLCTIIDVMNAPCESNTFKPCMCTLKSPLVLYWLVWPFMCMPACSMVVFSANA